MGPEPLLLITHHMRALRQLCPAYGNGSYIKLVGLIEAQGDYIRANVYGTKMREVDHNTAFLMLKPKDGQFGYAVTAAEKLKGVTNLEMIIREKRLKVYRQFAAVGKRSFNPNAEAVNRKKVLHTLLDEALRLRFDPKGKITGKDGPGKQDDLITALFMGIFKSNMLRRRHPMINL